MIDFDNQTTVDVDSAIFEPILEFLSDKDLEVLIVTDEEIAAINAQTRAKNTPTDVLSFPLEDVPHTMILGTIVISIDHVVKLAKALGHTQDDECRLLFLHGLLHLLGYDHETDDGEMRSKEAEIISHFNLPKSLIIRTEES